MTDRRKFIKQASRYAAGYSLLAGVPLLLPGCSSNSTATSEKTPDVTSKPEKPSSGDMFFSISLAQWSLHKTLFDKQMTNLQFPEKARKLYGINAVEYVNAFFMDKAEDEAYLAELNKVAKDNGVKNVLIMIDSEGSLGDLDKKARTKAVENHYKWVTAAKTLGCHSIRVNARGEGTEKEVSDAAIDGLGRLSEFGAKHNINVIVENHGGYSSDGKWLSNVISKVNQPNCGTLPDFGNFFIDRDKGIEYDRYKGTKELMPFAKGVSAKSNDFNEAGDEIHTDYRKMLKIVKEAGYKGYIGVEYEGKKLSEHDGILATKNLLEKIGKEMG